jgi:GT2 family glycosyltransferase
MALNFSLSIVSHGHRIHIRNLLQDLAALGRDDFDVILTINLPEELPLDLSTLPFAVQVIHNSTPKGFAANHNAAFVHNTGRYFVVLNPDIRLIGDPFPPLLDYISAKPDSICAPLVVNQVGIVEDSARLFPTPLFLLKKLYHKLRGTRLAADVIVEDDLALYPDWIAGMFVVVAHETYGALGGLSERYHMYYEDVDFCVRARLVGQQIAVVKGARVIHEAQRDSHRKLRHLLWHISSILRFFLSKGYFQLQLGRVPPQSEPTQHD